MPHKYIRLALLLLFAGNYIMALFVRLDTCTRKKSQFEKRKKGFCLMKEISAFSFASLSIDRSSVAISFFSLVLEKLGRWPQNGRSRNRFQNPSPHQLQRELFIPLSTCDERGGQCTEREPVPPVTGTEPIFLSFPENDRLGWLETLNRNGRYVVWRKEPIRSIFSRQILNNSFS